MKREPLNLVSVAEKDWVRLAAFIDGEGSILLNRFVGRKKTQRRLWLRVIVVNTDIRLPQWIVSVFGGTCVSSDMRKSIKHRQCWRWQVSCRQAAQILEGCLPYFLLKREQAEVALCFQSTVRGPGHLVTQEVSDLRERMRQQLHDMKADNGRFNSDKYTVPVPEKTGPKPNIKDGDDPPYLIQ